MSTTSGRIQLKLQAFDHALLDLASKEIIDTAKRVGAKLVGPIPLPTKREIITLLRSPHVNKDARDQIERRTHARLIYIEEPDHNTIEAFSKLNLASGIGIQVKLDEE